ncbi:hypothetical protein GCM10007338_02340 [Corynebacterium pelargi]|nr:hypothetical protein GCM10007338_02340 [Corynebacterium pelargi]
MVSNASPRSQRGVDWCKIDRVSTSTQTIERPEIREDLGNDQDVPKFFHYVKKDQIVDSAVSGKMVVALCGETFPVTKQAKPGSPVCPDCERVYRGLRKK